MTPAIWRVVMLCGAPTVIVCYMWSWFCLSDGSAGSACGDYCGGGTGCGCRGGGAVASVWSDNVGHNRCHDFGRLAFLLVCMQIYNVLFYPHFYRLMIIHKTTNDPGLKFN
eukprot:TRINITY_DN5047_c0_g1_i1.p2 TRINITY_DN5047_c0_g1~~TRINITY_DN5047_c0_g1_i1.p2  ORF type:complete len:111 (-),score=5.29 TRINITY_DN5047_c0_g1_i1:150-482(-)